MAEAAIIKEEKKTIDEGLEIGAQNLTEERIAKVINRVLKGESGARLTAVCAPKPVIITSPTIMIPTIHRWAKSSKPCGRC
jgi:hypothetical protein